jgi:hypothetical protein
MPDGFCTLRIADRIIIQFDLPAGCRKHFVARPHPGLLPVGEGESFGINSLFYARPPIQPWVYPEALGTFHPLFLEKAIARPMFG